MQFTHGQTVTRLRPRRIPSPSNPSKTVPAEWDDEPEELVLDGAYIGPGSNTSPPDPTRAQAIVTNSLYLTDVTVDVRRLDYVRTSRGVVYSIPEIPEVYTNPFTNWTPVLEVPLKFVEG